jgi:hypothetical protein
MNFRDQILVADKNTLVAKLQQLGPEWANEWLNLQGFSGRDIEKCNETQLQKLISLPAAIWLFNNIHDSVTHLSPSFLIYSSIDELNRICSSNDHPEHYRKSCAAEIGRRLFQSESLRVVNGQTSLKVSVPQLNERTVQLMMEEGWDLRLLRGN